MKSLILRRSRLQNAPKQTFLKSTKEISRFSWVQRPRQTTTRRIKLPLRTPTPLHESPAKCGSINPLRCKNMDLTHKDPEPIQCWSEERRRTVGGCSVFMAELEPLSRTPAPLLRCYGAHVSVAVPMTLWLCCLSTVVDDHLG